METEVLGGSDYWVFCSFCATVSKVPAFLLNLAFLPGCCIQSVGPQTSNQSQRSLKGWVLWYTFSTPWVPEVVDRRVQFLPLNCCVQINLLPSKPSHVWWFGFVCVQWGFGFFFQQWGYLLVEGSYRINPCKTAALLKILATKQFNIHLRMLHTIPAVFCSSQQHLHSLFLSQIILPVTCTIFSIKAPVS